MPSATPQPAMDIARGPRRARHVASNATATINAAGTATANAPAGTVAGRALAVPAATTPAPVQLIQTTATPANPIPAQTPEEQHLNSQPPLHVPPPRRQPRSDSDHPRRQEQRRQQLPQVTPTYNPNPNNTNHRSHLTPEQLRYHDRASPPGVTGPPVNPFRLNRGQFVFISFFTSAHLLLRSVFFFVLVRLHESGAIWCINPMHSTIIPELPITSTNHSHYSPFLSAIRVIWEFMLGGRHAVQRLLLDIE